MSMPPNNAAVWFEMPARDLEKSARFFESVLQKPLARQMMGGQEMIMFPADDEGVGGHLYEAEVSPAAQAPVVHLACSAPLANALDRVEDAGGQVVSDIIDLPGGENSPGRYVYCTDLDGSRFGLFAPS